ncbi:efflux transporter, RND family, MFP subunit [Afipia felis]|uniref:Efflux transporter, RND family, MFP subunit n=1 Tax=Afipia felis TaxID=1035 RepID=A0A090MVJ0_AFIFE|nr:efflux RND transporter periplasmic adaptor subunit [Afipia felis]CEG10552.1 efflux transporter, RND family, MFP subunit [Afipia felis]
MSTPKMMRRALLRSVLVAGAVICVGVAATWGFIRSHNEVAAEAERERPIKAPLRVSMQNGAPVVRLDLETEQRNGIETTALMPSQHQEQLRAYGTVLDLARLTDLSNSYAAAKAQLQTAQAKIEASRADVDRSRTLYEKPGTIPLKQLQAAEATFGVDKAAVAAAESQVRTLTATANQEWGPVLGKSLVDGSAMVTGLIERHDFLVQVTLPPGESMSKLPETAVLQIGKTAQAIVTYVSPATRTDPKIQGVSYFYIASADSGVLPGMSVLAFLSSGDAVEGTLIPAASIVWLQGRAWIYRRTEPNTFTRIAISTDQSTPDGGYFVGGLPLDVQVVTRGAQSLLSEEFRAQLRVGEDQK